jgi:hypothetical protein
MKDIYDSVSMGNIASAVRGGVACAAGAVVVIIAKPACDYTIRLVVKNTSLIVSDQLAAVEADVRRAVELITATSESLNDIKETQRDMCKLLYKDQGSETHDEATDGDGTHAEQIANLEAKMSKIENVIVNTMNEIVKANESIGALPGVIDTTTKKYSMYLHDEHVSMLEVMKQ